MKKLTGNENTPFRETTKKVAKVNLARQKADKQLEITIKETNALVEKNKLNKQTAEYNINKAKVEADKHLVIAQETTNLYNTVRQCYKDETVK